MSGVVTQLQLKVLAPLLEGNGEDPATGEWAMHCPFHGDSKRSASLNVNNGAIHCHGCDGGWAVAYVIRKVREWNLDGITAKRSGRPATPPLPSRTAVETWVRELLDFYPERLSSFIKRRGLLKETIEAREIGWNPTNKAYTIPVYDQAHNIVNVRYYQLDPEDGRRKIWSVAGHGEPHLYPVDQLAKPALVICEGELDALMLIQNGIPAVTRTAAADVWNAEWSPLFAGKEIYLCHDMDSKGQHANGVMSAALRDHADVVHVIQLPYPVTEKHGKDITDWFLEGHQKKDFMVLVRAAKKVGKRHDPPEAQPELIPVSVMDSYAADKAGVPLAMHVTITGKRTPPNMLPEQVVYKCSSDFSATECPSCPGFGGMYTQQIEPSDPVYLSLMRISAKEMSKTLRAASNIPSRCNKVSVPKVLTFRTVEEVYVRPSIEDRSSQEPDFTHRKVVSVGTHDLVANQTVLLKGTIRPNPNNQENEFQAWKVERPPSTLDRFAMTPVIHKTLSVFRPSAGQTPLAKLDALASDLADGVTHIRGRTDLHIFIDLVFHSALEFKFGKENEKRGYLDALVIGDTRTGKSKVAQSLVDFYGLGEMISCESATIAGVMGGLDRTDDNRWVIKWGSIPMNDRRIVVLDEINGLSHENIEQMSALRSSGVAQLTKIKAEHALARTRLVWLSNPRKSGMDTFTYGVQAVRPLIGSLEDVARFDMVMGVFSSEVKTEEINKEQTAEQTAISHDAYRQLVLWAWTRRASDVVWDHDAVEYTLGKANELGAYYSEDPPLVQGANVRLKLARIATAIAIRTYSSDDGRRVLVNQSHVDAAVDFLDRIYSNVRFGYGAISKQTRIDVQDILEHLDEIMAFINSFQNGSGALLRFLRNQPKFSRSQLELALNLAKENVQDLYSKLYAYRAIRFDDQLNLSVVDAHVLGRIRGE